MSMECRTSVKDLYLGPLYFRQRELRQIREKQEKQYLKEQKEFMKSLNKINNPIKIPVMEIKEVGELNEPVFKTRYYCD